MQVHHADGGEYQEELGLVDAMYAHEDGAAQPEAQQHQAKLDELYPERMLMILMKGMILPAADSFTITSYPIA